MTPQPHIGQRIHAQFEELSAQEKRVAGFILDHFDDLAVYSAADLSRLTGVSKSTVSRLFKRLGFASFQAVRAHARELRSLGVPLVTDARAVGNDGERFRRHAQRELDNLSRCFADIAPQDFAEIIDFLDVARRIVVVGFRNSYPLAMHCRQQLIQAREQVSLAPEPNQSLAEELAGLTCNDMVIVFGFRRRPSIFDAMMKALDTMPCRVLLVADPSAKKYGKGIDWHLECPLDSVSAFDSYASAMSLVCLLANGLLHLRLTVGRHRIDTVSDLYQRLEELSI
ncbi:MurR/RpiR family transcriptional regulator [Halomonas sp. McH1-25]|uniref:MurR/RpiR family transcriptional regulator n=1 Tax=unclassified Halomonas TaxID=2609666 RepID=UPI001EF5817D|nr:MULTISPECIES: MurR/RpiR family transcriptional regulator [unclassified Halomonas]MCG7599574.1 MurR/RpiR family transcriptional regulator [Halomonas sp. McH1-25]MCP1342153.1 MurR/RpiR family transcriptional regulator [Halomonas sp. FL8]MCP1362364.1 MurR/RpiR family transcriptional regulator [Halomonas sp. BBD45]MCP1366044.1 MurR/RpiR family transcriptional regulator [Halomonas sp. BBD48]